MAGPFDTLAWTIDNLTALISGCAVQMLVEIARAEPVTAYSGQWATLRLVAR